MVQWIKRYATHVYAVSKSAAEANFGVAYGGQENFRVLTGLDLAPFLALPSQREARARIGIAERVPVVGHVGSFREQKNHAFLVEVAKEIVQVKPNIVFLLVGAGPLRQAIEDRVRQAGMAASFRFLGDRRDVPQILAALDAFILPSHYEGLPRVLLEAQAAGLPCVTSAEITREAASEEGVIRFLPLAAGAGIWSASVLDAFKTGPSFVRGQKSVEEFKLRGLSIQQNASVLTRVYKNIQRNECASAPR